MSKVLSQLLSANEPDFSLGLKQLEKISGHNAIDIKLTADIAAKVKMKTKELGLRSNDTTGQELYHALQGLIALHDGYLAKAIGTSIDDPTSKQLTAIRKTLNKAKIPRSCWAIKHSVAKKLLKINPPKKVMKLLGYKSIDSMLKRENIVEIYSAVRLVESQSWQKKLVASYKKLSPSDFEQKDIEVVLLDDKKWIQITEEYTVQNRKNISHLKELGVISILPIPVDGLRGVIITVLTMAIHYMSEIRSYSSLFKMLQVSPDFGNILSKVIQEDSKDLINIANQPVHWRIVQRHFGVNNTTQAELFEPHVQLEDLFWQRAEDILYRLEPALMFWKDLEYSASQDGKTTISLNLMDNAVSYCNQLEYGQQSTDFFRESLWNEIYMRYMGQESVEKLVVEQLSKYADISEMELE